MRRRLSKVDYARAARESYCEATKALGSVTLVTQEVQRLLSKQSSHALQDALMDGDGRVMAATIPRKTGAPGQQRPGANGEQTTGTGASTAPLQPARSLGPGEHAGRSLDRRRRSLSGTAPLWHAEEIAKYIPTTLPTNNELYQPAITQLCAFAMEGGVGGPI